VLLRRAKAEYEGRIERLLVRVSSCGPAARRAALLGKTDQ
jgi:hypothetical protein